MTPPNHDPGKDQIHNRDDKTPPSSNTPKQGKRPPLYLGLPTSRTTSTIILLALISTPIALTIAATVALILIFNPSGVIKQAESATTEPKPPPRIVAFSPAIAQTLRDINLAHLIVARHGYDQLTDQSLPPVGDQAGVNYERLIAVNPTHIFTQFGNLPTPPRLQAIASEQHWSLIDLPLTSLDHLLAAIDRIADELSPAIFPQSEPDELRRRILATPRVATLHDLATGKRNTFNPQPHQSIIILYSTDPPAAAGPGSFHHDVAERLGLNPFPRSGPAYQTLDAEDLIRLDPYAIVLILPAPQHPAPPPEMPTPQTLGRLATLGLNATQNNRLAHLSHPAIILPSTRIADLSDTIEKLAKQWGIPQHTQTSNSSQPAPAPKTNHHPASQ